MAQQQINHNLAQSLISKKLKECSIHRLMKNVIFVAQMFGLFPVYGITKEANNLIFKWVSIKTAFAIFMAISQTMYTYIISTSSSINIDNFFSFVVIIWNIRALLGIIIFLKIGYKWPQLLKRWTEVEKSMLYYGPITNIKRRFQIISLLFLAMGVFEHSLFVYGGTKKVLAIMKDDDNFLKMYFKTLYGEFFNQIEYNHVVALLIEFLTLMSTFSWSFYDLFIILITSALAERFQQINETINTKQVLSESQWMKIRQQYHKLSFLCKMLNDVIAELVLLSFFGNVYFLSVFLFQSFAPRSPFETFYFWYDVLFNTSHFVLVCFYSAWVNEESIESKFILFSVPTVNINFQIDRFFYQIVTDDVAIEGAGLFKITRSTIIDTAKVIITLQLIFFQFDARISPNVA